MASSTPSGGQRLRLRQRDSGGVGDAHTRAAALGGSSRRAARADENATQVLAARIMRVQHIIDVAVQLRWRALIARLELGAEIGPFFTSSATKPLPKGCCAL